MYFNSPWFFLVFLPLVVTGFLLLRRAGNHSIANYFLICASFLFYALWNPSDFLVLLASIVLNFALAKLVAYYKAKGRVNSAHLALIAAIIFNLALLVFFKYTNFIAQTFGFSNVVDVALPLGISFFTFQKIAYQVDNSKGMVSRDLRSYAQFVSFFPQLIAGPIVHYREMMPQFAVEEQKRRDTILDVELGIFLFAVGLFKKVVVADNIAAVASPIYAAADSGAEIGMAAAWMSALGYTAQLYFDFSGYCDMALGAARMFGIRLPANFLSPYQATSVIDFWQRWHITLSRFLRDYLYIPLGGNRRGQIARYRNLMITMLLGGLWHGAGWTFVFWGFLHGLYLVINHAFRSISSGRAIRPRSFRLVAWLVTMLAVVVAWVFFRAETFGGATGILLGMAGYGGPEGYQLSHGDMVAGSVFTGIALAFAALAPNVYDIAKNYQPALDDQSLRSVRINWRPSFAWRICSGLLLALSIMTVFSEAPSEFLYFRF